MSSSDSSSQSKTTETSDYSDSCSHEFLDKEIIIDRRRNKKNKRDREDRKDRKDKPRRCQNKTKVVINALCAVMQSSGRLSGRIKNVEGHLSEIPLLRKEILAMNEKLDQLLEILKEISQDPEVKSTFLNYFLS